MLNQITNFDAKILLGLNAFFAQHSNVTFDKIFAEYLIYLIPLILIVLWFGAEKSKKVTLKAVFAVILAWPVMAYFIGNWVNRARPFELTGVKELVFHRPDYSFPSDHAAAIFAIVFSLWFSGYKKLSYTVLVMGIVVSFFRVATAIHYPTDILGGIVVGLVAAYLIELFDRPLNLIYTFIIKIMRFLHLA